MGNYKLEEIKKYISYDTLVNVFKCVPCYMFFKDTDCVYRFVSDKSSEYNAFSMGLDVIGMNDIEVFGEEKGRPYFEADKEVMCEEKLISYESVFNHKGIESCFSIKKGPVYNEEGCVVGIVGIAVNITEVYLAQKKLKKDSITDTLTGVYNRNYYEEQKNNRVKEEDLPLSVIMGDADGLKQINDGFGHRVGDNFLKEVSGILKFAVGKENDIFRVGGDEFVIVLKNTDEKNCRKMIDSIHSIAKKKSTAEFAISISLGGATTNCKDEVVENLVTEAECKMYREKIVKKEMPNFKRKL